MTLYELQYASACRVLTSAASYTNGNGTSLPGLRITDNVGSATNENTSGYIYIYNALSGQRNTTITYHATFMTNGGAAGVEYGIGVHPTARFDNGLRFHPDINGSSTFTGGAFTLYGIRSF